FYLPETSRWSYLKENAKQPDIASKVDKALSDIEKENKPLQGALPNNYYSSLGIEAEKLGSLIDKIDGFDDILASADGN
ncbi:type I restriction-modification system subunit M N-terminal domain-containing protein, partial [uncultured Duncaniella sp.]